MSNDSRYPPRSRRAQLSRLLLRALRLLGDAGAADAAATLAASAWSALRAAGEPGAERFTGLLHYLTLGHTDSPEEKR